MSIDKLIEDNMKKNQDFVQDHKAFILEIDAIYQRAVKSPQNE